MRGDEGDAAAVEAARGGDGEACALLLSRHRPLLLALCRRALGDVELAEDAAQEACLQALLNLDRLRQPEQFGPWLAGIGLNVCRLWLRLRSREGSWEAAGVRLALAASPDEGDNPATLAEAAELTARVRQAVEGLPDGQRAAVLLFYLSDLSYAETADFLGIGVGAVRTRLHKARGALRQNLRPIWREDHYMNITDTKVAYACSFCGKNQAQVRRLIAGPNGVFICNECVTLCNSIIGEEEAQGANG